MNIMNFLRRKTGKMALSAMQAVGLSAAVGVAGIAAWQMMGSSSEPSLNTVFSSTDNQEIIYVAGGAGMGGYASGNYGAGGEVQSGIRAKMSHDMQLMQEDAARAEVEANNPAFVQQEQQVQAFKMDGVSGGLGMGANAAHEMALGGNADMSGVQQQIAALQASMAAKQKEALAAAGAAGDVASQAAAALQGKGAGKWGMADGMARASGHNLNSTPLQAGSGREGTSVSPSGVLGGAGQPGGIPGSLDPASGNVRFEGGRGSSIGFGRRMDAEASLAGLQKQSADIARYGTRSANEGTKAFLASSQLSGGIRLNDGEQLTTGSASSDDFSTDSILSGLGAAGESLQTMEEAYEEAREQLRQRIKDFVKSCNNWSMSSPLFAWIGYAAKVRERNSLRKQIQSFEDTWGDSSFEQTNTQGGYAKVSRETVDDVFGGLWLFGQPKKRAKDKGREYWGDAGAFI